jgi:iron complex transport system substrate-binding protein
MNKLNPSVLRSSILRQILIASLACTIAALASCAPKETLPQHASTRSVTDDLGRNVELPQPVSRAISLAPSITELIYAAGAGDRLVGVTTYCNYPAETASIEKIGDTLNPNIEKIIALKPDVVFVSTASQLEAFMQTLEEQRIAVYVIDSKSVSEMLEDLGIIGSLFGTESSAESTASALEKRVNDLHQKLAPNAPQRVFIQISNEPLFTIGKDSFLTNLIETAGGSSVTKDVPSAYPKLSKETALALNPDVIILSDSEDNQEPNDVFKNSPAVKNGRVYKINADIISRPGPRQVDAIEQIAGFLHGEKN